MVENPPLHLLAVLCWISAIDLHASPVPNPSVVHLQMSMRVFLMIALAIGTCHGHKMTNEVVPEVLNTRPY